MARRQNMRCRLPPHVSIHMHPGSHVNTEINTKQGIYIISTQTISVIRIPKVALNLFQAGDIQSKLKIQQASLVNLCQQKMFLSSHVHIKFIHPFLC